MDACDRWMPVWILFSSSNRSLSGAVRNNEPGSATDVNITGAEQNLVLPIAAVKLPRSLEQFEELLNNVFVRGIDDNTYHFVAFQFKIATGASCARNHCSKTTKLNKIL